ncbi:MAG: FHA domain-containing protein [Ruminococcus callidus]
MSVSRYHAVLYVSNGVWSVMDLLKIRTCKWKKIRSQVKLKDMDEIRFGTKSVIRQRRRGVRNV